MRRMNIRATILATTLAGSTLLLAGCVEPAGYYGTAYTPAPAPMAEQVPPPPPAHPYWVWARGHWNWNGYRWVWIRGHYRPA